MKNVWRVSELRRMNWFAIGAGSAVALSGAIALFRLRAGQPTPLTKPVAMSLLLLGLFWALFGAAPLFAE